MGESGQYQVISFGGQPVMAVPAASRRVMAACAGRYGASTWRRRAVREMARGACLLGIRGLLGRRTAEPLGALDGLPFAGWVDGVLERLAAPSGHAVLVWPRQRGRGRVGVHLLDSSLRAIGFAKVSLDEKNTEQLSREAKASAALAAADVRTFAYPRCLHAEVIEGRFTLVFEPLPEGARGIAARQSAYPCEITGELRRVRRQPPAPGGVPLDWLSRAKHCARSDGAGAFVRDLRTASEASFETCLVHGDFIPNNILKTAGQYWVADWEMFSQQGPVLLDEVTYWLSLRTRNNRMSVREARSRLVGRYISGQPRARARDAVLALAYRYAHGVGDATGIARSWESVL